MLGRFRPSILGLCPSISEYRAAGRPGCWSSGDGSGPVNQSLSRYRNAVPPAHSSAQPPRVVADSRSVNHLYWNTDAAMD